MENYFHMHMDPNQIKAISNLGLAHIGDGVFELLTRSWLCGHQRLTVGRMHKDTIALVQAKAQARFADEMLPLLTEEEKSLYRRGKNSHVHAVPKSCTPAEYAKATGVEAMFGGLYLAGETQRINEIFVTVMEALYGI
jgi:ribonuclease-3 family protein